MATKGYSHVHRNWKGLTRVLKSAASECLLIVLLFIDAAFSYFLTRFARYCELQVPCILCSRLDHVFGNEKPGYYWNLFCSNHKSEVSSLIFCNIHGKLVDGRGMCDNCLSSHIEENKSNSDTQRVLENCDSQSSFLSRDLSPASKCARLCLCCNKTRISRPNAQKLPPLKSCGVAVAKSNVYLPRRLRGRNGTKKIKDKFSAPAVTPIEKPGFDPSSHIGYTDLKITSELEPVIPFSDDEVSNCMARDMDASKKDYLVHSAPETPSKRLYINWDTRKQPDANDPHDFRCLHPVVLSENDVCDRKEQLADQKTKPLPEFTSLDDIPASSCLVEVPSYSASLLPELISLVDKPPSVNVTENPLEASSAKSADVTETSKNENISIDKNDKISRAVDDTAIVHSTDEDPSAVHVSPVCVEEKSVFVTEEPMPTYNNGFNVDQSLPIQNSSGEGVPLSFNNLSPELRGDTDDFDETTNDTNPYGVQSFHNYFTERNEFGSPGVNKDQSLPVQNSSGEGVPLSFNNLRPELQGDTDDFDETTNDTNPYGVQSFHNYVMERNEFGSPGVNKDQSLPVQNSSGEGVPLSFNNLRPELRGDTDDFDETTNDTNPYGVQSFHNYFTERNEYGSPGVNKDQSLPVQNSSGEGVPLSFNNLRPELRGDTDDFDETTNDTNPYGVQSFQNYFTERKEFGSPGVNKDQSLPVQNSSGGVPLSFNNLSPELRGDTDDFDETTNDTNPYGVQSFHNYFTETDEFGSPGVNKDQSLPDQNSSGEGIHLRSQSDDFETTNESNPSKVQSFDNLFVRERSDFGSLQSLDESSFNEIEGEDLVDRLKRLVEYYRKCMDELYRELEEERNASAVATNQAMAMITRLQEEKSALQMETLHYLRLMEEQTEYDGDALDKANDLLAEREKELQDLEAEIEFYRLNFTGETQMEALAKASINLSNGHVSMENMSTSFVKDELNFPSKTMFPETCDHNANPVAKSAWSEFEDEKLYISERLRNLERKVSRFAHHGTSPHISHGEYYDEAAIGGQSQQEFLDEKDKEATCEVEGNDLPVQKSSSVSNGSAPQESSSTSISKDQVVSKGNSHMVSNGQKGSEDCNKTGLFGLENEIFDLNERLDALVADCKFLEHSLKSLQNGNEGLLFVQEILHELREIRKLGIRCRNMSVS